MIGFFQQPASPPQPDSPIDAAAKFLKIDDKYVDVPAIPQLGIHRPTRVELIYILIAGVLFLIFGYRAILFALGIFIMFARSEKK